ncbi:MAG TPA: cysteine--tRNA ligase [Hyphomicrobiaceae bacterium]|nr:cysteine--tRNA ligase [Hyphomicrobiaceae bacterium]
MTLTLYNTLARRKESFQPIDPGNVRMYVCGPTVYDYAHIGNARPIIVFDVLFRLLRHIYGPEHVTYARNITDVDDKINARAAEQGIDIRSLTELTTRQFHEDIAALGVLPPTVEPRATEHIAEMQRLCRELVANGHAYVAEGHVLFDVASMPDYGRLANRSLEEMEAGARVEVAPYKKGPMDFVLWKPSKPGEPAWPSPCGIETPGRPGWHLECSAMSDRWLWQEPELKGLLSEAGLARPHVFDIHGGGIDLVFPHHENEIAQSRCAHGTPAMANYWLHNGFLQVEGEKMSKSLGNFVTINELLQEWPGEAIKLAMLSAHYRQPINWTRHALGEAKRTLDHWYELTEATDDGSPLCADVIEALADDLNTPQAITALHALRSEAAKGVKPAAACLKASARLLGLLQIDAATWKAWRPATLAVDDVQVEALIAARNAARKAKDFKEADRLRDELAGMGIQLKDSKDTATGEIKTTWEVRR